MQPSKQLPTQIIEKQPNPQVLQEVLKLGLTPLQAKLVAQRTQTLDELEKVVFPQLKNLQHPKDLKNSAQAADLIVEAIQADGLIVLSTDYDVDGVTSAWVAYQALTKYFQVPEERIKSLITQRKDGYGINEQVCDEILQLGNQVALVISADQGTSDEPRLAKLAAAGIKVCITDHHKIPDSGIPLSAACVVNPQQEGCNYDPDIAGCFVIFLVMTQVRQKLIELGLLAQDSPSLRELCEQVALGTIADSVSLLSPNNRAMVSAGINLINRFQTPAWQAFRQLNNNSNQPYTAEFLAFQVANRINAASRVNDVYAAFNFLNASNPTQAYQYLEQLEADNEERKRQQETMLQQALDQANEIHNPAKFSLALQLEGNPGIQGIIATRVGEKYGLPCVALTPTHDGSLAGSGRATLPQLDLNLAFNWMEQQQPDLFIAYGGHQGAAGCQIASHNFMRFAELLEEAIKIQLKEETPLPRLETDGQLPHFNLSILDEINQLEPFGRKWPKPQFNGRFYINNLRVIGQAGQHLSLNLQPEDQNITINAVFFNALEHSQTLRNLSYGQNDLVEVVYQPSLNSYMGRNSLQLRISYITPA